MSYRPNRQEQTKAHQLTLPFPGWGRRRADNDSDPFGMVQGSSCPPMVGMKPKPSFGSFTGDSSLFAGRVSTEIDPSILVADPGHPNTQNRRPAYAGDAGSVVPRDGGVPCITNAVHDAEVFNPIVASNMVDVINLPDRPASIMQGPGDAMAKEVLPAEVDDDIAPATNVAAHLAGMTAIPAGPSQLGRKVGARTVKPRKVSSLRVVAQKGAKPFQWDLFHSDPRPADRVFNGMVNDRRHAKRKVVSLDLHDLAARIGPANYDTYAEG